MLTREAPLGIVSHRDEQCAVDDSGRLLCDLCDAPFTDDDVRIFCRVHAHAPTTLVIHVQCCEIVSRYASYLLG